MKAPRLLFFTTLALASLAGLPLRAQEVVTDEAAIAAHYRDVLQREEFHQQATPDFLAQISHWAVTALQSLQDSFKQYEYSSQLVRLSYALMGVILVLGIISLAYWGFRLLRLRYFNGTIDTERAVGEPITETPETFEPEIRNAVSAQLWTTALMLSWRRFLSLLARQEFIVPDRSRTNWEHLARLKQQPVPKPVHELCRELTRRYDNHVYGAATVTPNDWAEWDASVEALIRTLKLNRPAPGQHAP